MTKAKVRAALLGRSSTPTKIGRFEVVGRAGAGAMGRVMIGHDPDLGRKVALKLIAVRADDPAATERLRERLLREARALASLSHPNVVVAYEVGLSEGDVYVAMEYVEGHTLREWSSQSRSWREIVGVYMQAGRGLAAAHAQGFVHRDFKPDNVLVGSAGAGEGAGRVRVADFGLARGPQADDAESTEDEPPSPSPADLATLTRTGARLGTPAYRAPEVEAGRPAEPASDQYSFCVALYESLHGHRPGEDRASAPAKRGDWPRWLDRVLERGLSRDPKDRYSSMDALLHDLQRPREARRRLVMAFAAVAALGAVLAISSMAALTAPPCQHLEDELDRVWDDAARARVQQRYAAESKSYVRDLGDRVLPVIDDHAKRWLEQRIDACESAWIREEQSDEVLAARLACLGEQKAELSATVRALAEPSDLERGPTLAHELPDPETCGEPLALPDPQELPAKIRFEVEAVRGELAEIRVLERTGELQPAADAVRALIPRAEQTEYEPLLAEVKSRAGRILGKLDDADAERTLRDAVWLAEARHLDALAADTWMHLVSWSEGRESKPADMEALLERASAAVERLGDTGARRARLHALSGRVATAAARYDDALAELEQAEAIHRRLDPRGPNLANVLDAIGAVHYQRGDYDRAFETFERAAVLYEKVYGPEHPKVAERLQNAGTALVAQQKQAEAIPKLERAHEILQAAYGADHVVLSSLGNTLGAAYEGLGRLEDAAVRYERALTIAETHRGPEHASLISPLTNLGRILPRLGRGADARARLERAATIAETVYGSEHPRVAEPLTSLGRLLLDHGDSDAAIRLHTRALQIRKKSAGENSLVTATSEHNLGDALSKAGRYEEALPHLESAQVIFAEHLPPEHVHHGINHLVRARTLIDAGRNTDGLVAAQAADQGLVEADVELRAAAKFEVARARATSGSDPEQARALAQDALRMLEGEPDAEDLRDRITTWLQ